jgi:hypothetical protein
MEPELSTDRNSENKSFKYVCVVVYLPEVKTGAQN